jgi:hypothetical protein
MTPLQTKLKTVFIELDQQIEAIAVERRNEDLFPLPKSKILLLGQMSLLAQEPVSAVLALALTGDVDAHLDMSSTVKQLFTNLLRAEGWMYDEDSPLIWIPPKSIFQPWLHLNFVDVDVIDAESALVSKAVKAPAKNKFLVRQALSSGHFPNLAQRIVENSGNLEDFA